MIRALAPLALLAGLLCSGQTMPSPALPAPPDLDRIAAEAMATTGAQGLAIAVTEPGRVIALGAWGKRDAAGDPLTPETVMYGASLTKAVFAYYVGLLVREGAVDLDRPLAAMLARPLPEYPDPDDLYAPWPDLADDPRWQEITPRMVLTHSTGFANFYWLNDGEKLRIHFDPGTRYAYSGDGMMLLQFGLEKGQGRQVGAEMQARVFARFGMTRSAMIWRGDFAGNLADGWDSEGKAEPHDERSRVRAAGSLDTTIADFARFSAGVAADRAGFAELARPILPITTPQQFPTLLPEVPPEQRFTGVAAALGTVAFEGPQGPGFFKGGHNDTTGNTWVCLARTGRCVAVLANDVRAEAAFPAIVRAVLGETGVPWRWEYGDRPWTR